MMNSNHPQIKMISTNSNVLIVCYSGGDVTFGAPHHAPGGTKTLPCPAHPMSDENTGYIVLKLSEMLKMPYVIASNSTVDPNKSKDTSYFKDIEHIFPKLLIEIHGHGAKKLKDNVIEISSGRQDRSWLSERFSEILKEKLSHSDTFKDYCVHGKFQDLHFKATKSLTITDDRWLALHIELPPSVRIGEDDKLPQSSDEFVKLLGESITEFVAFLESHLPFTFK